MTGRVNMTELELKAIVLAAELEAYIASGGKLSPEVVNQLNEFTKIRNQYFANMGKEIDDIYEKFQKVF